MSVRFEGIEGNVNRDEELGRLHVNLLAKGGVERVLIGRNDATKNRLRITSDRGRDIMVDVPRGFTIRHGDVLSHDLNHMLLVEWMPEDTMILTVDRSGDWKDNVELAIRVGYILGMKHFQPFVAGNEVNVPVERTREDMLKPFRRLRGISIRFEKRILEGAEEVEGHEHQQ